MKSGRHTARLLAVAALVITAGFVIVPGGAPASAAPATPLASGGEYHPLTPTRIFDSRPATTINDVAPLGAKQLGAPDPAVFDIQLLGLGGVPADATPGNVLAVVVNITVTEPGASGYLEAYGKDARPATRTSIIDFAPNQTIPNVAIVRPGADGQLEIGLFGQKGTAQVVVDVFGWFSTSNWVPNPGVEDDGSRLIPVTPARVLDTRDGTGQPAAGALAAHQTIDLQVRGVNSVNPVKTAVVPDSPNITGVLLNVVGITTGPGAASTYLSLLPDAPPSGQDPTTSNLDLVPGVVMANLVFVPVGADGKVHIFNFHGNTDVVADVVGYLQKSGADKSTRAGRVVPLTSPYRTFDTRDASFGSVPLGPGQAEDWSFSDFAASVAIGPDAVGNQLAVIGNFTSASLARQYPSVPVSSFMTAYPADAPSLPGSSNIDTVEGPALANMAVLTYPAATSSKPYVVRVYNLKGYAHYLFDASAVVLND
ncbi:MAG: hypothetical protein ACXVLX_10075 [Ilumatobacteraceae bacterium]